jgi:hypothetical protein
MNDADEWDIARAMIRLYGRKAEKVAAGHADTFAKDGDLDAVRKWRRVRDIIAELRPFAPDSDPTKH